MAKSVNTLSLKCSIDLENNTVTEYNAKGEEVGNHVFSDMIHSFDDKIVSLTIKEETEKFFQDELGTE